MIVPRRWDRTACSVLLCLAGGLTFSLLNAWFLGNVSLQKRFAYTEFRPTVVRAAGLWWGSQHLERLGLTTLNVRPFATFAEADAAAVRPFIHQNYGPLYSYIDLPGWAANTALIEENQKRTPLAPNSVISTFSECQVGWPVRCLSGMALRGAINGRRLQGPGLATRGMWIFPLRPLPLGLTLNTIFYASLSALLWFTLARTRASLRRRRGLCPNCKYNLRGLTPAPAASDPTPKSALRVPSSAFPTITCPECGTTHRPRASPAAPSAPPP